MAVWTEFVIVGIFRLVISSLLLCNGFFISSFALPFFISYLLFLLSVLSFCFFFVLELGLGVQLLYSEVA